MLVTPVDLQVWHVKVSPVTVGPFLLALASTEQTNIHS